MFKLAVVGTVAALATAKHHHPINHDIVNEVKAKAQTWTAHEAHENPLKDMSLGEIYGLLGTKKIDPVGDYPAPEENASLPSAFDSRTAWPDCVHSIRDQQKCGSCWAFGASEALSDRFCVASSGKLNEVLSPQDMVSCDNGDMGCNGGWLFAAWDYLEHTGIVSDACKPYTSGDGSEPKCSKSCSDGSAPKKFKCKKGSVVEATTPNQIKSNLMKMGPMETAFQVYEDFFQYKGGIYHYTSGNFAGGHAVKLIGWGTENGVNYWTLANSWGTKWGENGFFRVQEGEVGIDDSVYACTPDVAASLL
jgi:cathepsin B